MPELIITRNNFDSNAFFQCFDAVDQVVRFIIYAKSIQCALKQTTQSNNPNVASAAAAAVAAVYYTDADDAVTSD